MISYSKSGAASEAVVNAFREIARRQGELAGHQRTLDALNNERTRIGEEQNRIRQNMSTIERESDLYRRYMTKFTEQESRLEAITEESLKAKQALDSAQASLDEFIAGLSVE
jgi:septation ring formation regulator EzrA